jgi:antitoxin component YwqK of YwqJK toxin-antitoxin module
MTVSEDTLIPNEEGRLCLPDGEPYNGGTEDTYENGQIAYRNRLLNGVKQGLQQEWYETGQLWSEETVCLGQLHGYRREWFPNGQLKLEELGENGFAVSVKHWDERGALVHESRYPYPSQKYETLLLWRAEARALGFGPPEDVDPSLLPP